MSFTIREIEEEDISKGFFETLSNLSTLGDISKDFNFAKKILTQIKQNDNYKIFVAEDNEKNQIVGTATLFIEQKFIHNGGRVGHIEDVVTRKGHEGKGIGKGIVKELIEIAKRNRCYKVILDCDSKVIIFYERMGFKKHATMMRMDL